MPGFIRSLLIALAVTLSVALPVGGWYWVSFREPPQTELSALQNTMPSVTRLLHEQEDLQAVALLDQLPYRVVVSDAGEQAVTSNLASALKRRKESGQLALQSGRFERFLLSEDGAYRYYYQLPSTWWDPHLLAPLLFGLLLGLAAVIWDLMFRRQLEDQTDALILLRQEINDDDHEAELEQLRQDKAQLKQQLEQMEKPRQVEPGLSAEAAADIARLRQHNQSLKDEVDALKAQTRSQGQHQEQEQKYKALEKELQGAQQTLKSLEQEQDALKSTLKRKEQEITELHQDKVGLQRELDKANERFEGQSEQSTQLHEAWQEIEALRESQTQLLQRQEQWEQEKRRLLGLMQEREEQTHQAQERLQEARKKIHELSVAYKKQLETIQNLPDSMKEVQAVLSIIIDEKDQLEHENAELRLDMAEKESELHRLHTELGVRQARLEESKRMIEELSDNLRSNERELGLLSDTLDDKLHDLERFKDLHNEESQALEAMTQERDGLRLQLAELDARLEKLQADRNQAILERDELQVELDDIDVEAYDLEIEQLRQSVKLMGQQQQRRTQVVEELKEKLKEGENLYNRLKRHAEQQDAEIRNLQQQLGRYRSELNLLNRGDEAPV